MRTRWLVGLAAIAAVASGCVTVERVSTSGSGAEANGPTSQVAVSGDGRYVAFVSTATNLVSGVTDGKSHVYRKDRGTGAIVVADVDAHGAVSPGAFDPAISDDGTKVAFDTAAALTSADTNTTGDVYVRDLTTATTTLASLMPDGSQIPTTYPSGASQPAFDRTGTKLAFLVYTGTLPPRDRIEIRDLGASTTTQAVGDSQITKFHWSRDGKHLLADTGCFQIGGCFPHPFVVDLADAYAHTPGDWCQGGAGVGISDDGRFIAYSGGNSTGESCDRVPLLYDRNDGSEQALASWSSTPDQVLPLDLSGDGRFVLLAAPDTSLPGGTSGALGLFLLDRQTDHLERISANAAGATADPPGDPADATPRLTRDGRTVVFGHSATNLVGDDTNGVRDAFARVVPMPEIGAAVPPSLPRGASHATVTVSGKEFLPGVIAWATDGVTIHSATPNGAGTQLVLDVSVAANAPTGAHLVTVANPAAVGIAGTPCACLGVT
ncbi:MAG: hypothetical protein ACXVK4_14685 [Acidimicrobiia bacterium]